MILGRSAKDILNYITAEHVEMVDFRFSDFLGTWHHVSYPAGEITEETFVAGSGFDGSSLRAWQTIDRSDMVIVPIPDTAFIDPFMKHKTMVLLCNVVDPIKKVQYSRDSRYIAQKAEAYMKIVGIGDIAYFGPEAEFFIFDDIRYAQNGHEGYYFIDSIEGSWNTGRKEEPNLGYKPGLKEGYFPVPPTDHLHDIRTEMVLEMVKLGIRVEAQHHEVSTAGQAEIDMRYGPLLSMADHVMKYKYIVKNVARKHGKTVTFMPKPIWNDNGSGMHVHLSIWKKGLNMFAGDGYSGLSDQALYAIGGILKHAPALLAFTNPTTNSYKRLVPGYEAPMNLTYSSRNRSAAIRIPMYQVDNKSAKRIEFRCPDPSCNPYLGFSAILMAALDGIEKKIDPGKPLDKNIYDLSTKALSQIPQAPHSLEGALTALENDHDFLLKGDVFTKDVIENWVAYKMEYEVNQLRLRPHPWEFSLYYGV